MTQKKILMRAGTTVLENLYATKTIFDDAIGGNVGNLVYANSVLRTLMTDEEMEIEAESHSTPKYRPRCSKTSFSKTHRCMTEPW